MKAERQRAATGSGREKKEKSKKEKMLKKNTIFTWIRWFWMTSLTIPNLSK